MAAAAAASRRTLGIKAAVVFRQHNGSGRILFDACNQGDGSSRLSRRARDSRVRRCV